MVRLYYDGKFAPGERLKLDQAELHYWKSVKRAQGEVQIFNSEGQWARGDWQGKDFLVSEVEEAPSTLLPVTVAMALPERSVIAGVIPMLSEIGVEKLILFSAARSQTSLAKLSGSRERWERMAIESARQCLRAKPLQIEMGSWETLLRRSEAMKLCFSEVELETRTFSPQELDSIRKNHASVLCVFGCEGGWTVEEFSRLKESGFSFCHLKIPVMKVATAVTACVGSLIATFFQDRMRWS